MFTMCVKMDRLPDSMCLDSGTKICEYGDYTDRVEIEVRGYVSVEFEGEIYRHYSDMPEELKELFFYNNDQGYDVAEAIEGYNPTELEAYCKECMDLFKEE